MNTLRKGDRGTVGFTAGRSWPDGWVDTVIDGDTEVTRLSPEAIARATILPRKLEVGMRVKRNDAGRDLDVLPFGVVLCIDGDVAGVRWQFGSHDFVRIPNLTPIDSDEPSDDEKGAE